MTTVEKIKAKILDLAIRGKLVPQNPDDEPASILLERIKAEKAELVKAGKIKKDKNPSEIVVDSDGVTYEKFSDGNVKDISDEIPFELPQGWVWARFKQLGSFVGGHTPSLAVASNWENGSVLWVTSKDMKQKYIKDTGFKLSRSGAARLHLLPIGSLLMVTRSGILRRTFPIALAAKRLTINQDQRAIEFHNNKIGEYIYYCIKSLESIILRDYRKTGTTVESIIWEKFIDILLPLPSLSEQKRIVTKIDELLSYAKEIGEASEGISQVVQRIDKKILDLAIRGQLVPQDPNDEPACELIKRIEAVKNATNKGNKSSRTTASDRPAYEIEPPFEIPDSWEWVKLGKLVKIIAGVSYQKDDVTTNGVRILRGGNIKEDANIHLFDDDVFLPLSYANEESTIHSGDIVIVASTGSSTVIGRPAVAKEALPGIQIGAFLRIVRPVVAEVESWMPVLFLGDYYRRHIRGKSKGTNIKNLKAEYLSDLLIPLPPVAEQKRIVAKIEELRAMTRALTK